MTQDEESMPAQAGADAHPVVSNNDDGDNELGEDESKHLTEASVPWYCGNMTPWWFLSTLYMLLFVVYMGFRAFGHASAAFVIHTLVAFAFIVACAWNLLHTPSQGKMYKESHIWIGRIAMMSGTFVVVTGYVLVLTGNSSLSHAAEITFMATGAMQILFQGCLVFAIRVKKSTYYHMLSACVLFYVCALLPALNRLPQIFGFADPEWFPAVIVPIGVALSSISIGYYAQKMYSTNS